MRCRPLGIVTIVFRISSWHRLDHLQDASYPSSGGSLPAAHQLAGFLLQEGDHVPLFSSLLNSLSIYFSPLTRLSSAEASLPTPKPHLLLFASSQLQMCMGLRCQLSQQGKLPEY
jgi:hypothetical protein